VDDFGCFLRLTAAIAKMVQNKLCQAKKRDWAKARLAVQTLEWRGLEWQQSKPVYDFVLLPT
jgi:hypothetical protein